jgi:cell division protein FtsB
MTNLSRAIRREWPSLILSLTLAALVSTFVLGQEGPGELSNLVSRRTRLATENRRLRDENLQLELEVARLRTDDHYLQRRIRQELGYARPNEFVYHFHSSESGQR